MKETVFVLVQNIFCGPINSLVANIPRCLTVLFDERHDLSFLTASLLHLGQLAQAASFTC